EREAKALQNPPAPEPIGARPTTFLELQAAANAAVPGSTITLKAGARFAGLLKLPVRPAGAAPVLITTDAVLPERRITEADAPLLPILAPVSNEGALWVRNTSGWTFRGIKFESTPNGADDIIQMDNADHVTLDRVLMVAGPTGQKRGVRWNGTALTITRSHIANIWRAGQDSQAVCTWDGAGPYTVTDSYLEAASENAIFGGSQSLSADRIPSDILFEGNHLSKRDAWRVGPAGTWQVKNLFELKNAKRVIVRNNLMEHNWIASQPGYAVQVTVRSYNPWETIEDVVFEGNTIRDTEYGINFLGADNNNPSGLATRFMLRNNLIQARGRAIQIGGEWGELTIDHNTFDNGGTFLGLYLGSIRVAEDGGVLRPSAYAVKKLTVTNNLAKHGTYGITGEGLTPGTPALAQAVTWSFLNNVLAGGDAIYKSPPTTRRPTLADYAANFGTDGALLVTSAYVGAGTDGKDLGK
ncbi:MAG TPA: right-handed parallel beta-helix repeat-containing protein, partial [Vicinamibacterales bacterium]|nr:right-handed parallel beta-helix repeat-containing protein [Vicinamibacterales bacterium]